MWRSGHCAGVRVERFGKAPPPVVPEEQNAAVEPAESYAALGRRRSRFSQF